MNPFDDMDLNIRIVEEDGRFGCRILDKDGKPLYETKLWFKDPLSALHYGLPHVLEDDVFKAYFSLKKEKIAFLNEILSYVEWQVEKLTGHPVRETTGSVEVLEACVKACNGRELVICESRNGNLTVRVRHEREILLEKTIYPYRHYPVSEQTDELILCLTA